MSSQTLARRTHETTKIPVKRIVTHHWPHLDEIAAIMLLKEHGVRAFPGVESARVEYASTGDTLIEGKTAEQHEAEGTLLVGIGGGRFDEHPSQGTDRKPGECACSLVAKYLKRDGDPVWGSVIKYVTEADLAGVSPLHIASELKRRYRQNPQNPQETIGFARDCINSILREQELFHEARRMITSSAVAHARTVQRGNTKEKLRIVAVQSDNTQMAAAARSLGVGILIQRNKRGHVCIMTDGRQSIDLGQIMQRIRLAEITSRGGDINTLTDEEYSALTKPGKCVTVPNWYFQVPGHNGLNGSETTPDTEPTAIKFGMIFEFVCDKVEEVEMRLPPST